MAASNSKPAATTKAPAKRQLVGKSATTQGKGTSTPKGEAPKPTGEQRAEAAAEQSTDGVAHITCANSGRFTLRAEYQNAVTGEATPEWTLDFGDLGFIEADDETLDAVKQVLAGKWKDRRTTGRQFLDAARLAGLSIKVYGLEPAPIPSWDTVNEVHVVGVAEAAGLLSSTAQLRSAIRYEKQSPQRQPARDPRPSVLKTLEAKLALAEVAAGDGNPNDPSVISEAVAQLGGPSPDAGAAGGLDTSSSELG